MIFACLFKIQMSNFYIFDKIDESIFYNYINIKKNNKG
jgi:hypothetical protein